MGKVKMYEYFHVTKTGDDLTFKEAIHEDIILEIIGNIHENPELLTNQ